MSNYSSINWEQLDLITDGDQELGKEFVLMFLENAEIYVDELRGSIANAEAFGQLCHKLKGAAKSVGADNVAVLSLQGEGLAKNSDKINQEDFTTLINEISQALKNINDIIS